MVLAIKSVVGKPYSEVITQSICDITFSCPKCKFQKELFFTKLMIDNHITSAIELKCPNCNWIFDFYIAYHKNIEKEGDSILISSKPIVTMNWGDDL